MDQVDVGRALLGRSRTEGPSGSVTQIGAVAASDSAGGRVEVYIEGVPVEVATNVSVKSGQSVTVTVVNHVPTVTGVAGWGDQVAVKIGEIAAEVAYIDQAYIQELVANSVTAASIVAAAAYVGLLEADEITVDTIRAASAYVGALEAEYADVAELAAALAKIGKLDAEKADIDLANIDTANIAKGFVDWLNAGYAHITDGVIDNAKIGFADVQDVRIESAMIDVAEIRDLLVKSGIIGEFVSESGKVTGVLDAVRINADAIKAGTLSVDRLLLRGEGGLFYELNATTDGVTAEQLASEEYQNALHGDNIVASSVTADKISVSDLVAFGATIGGLVIEDGCLRSFAKGSLDSGSAGFYLGRDGSFNLGGRGRIKYDAAADSLDIKASNISVDASPLVVSTKDEFYSSTSPAALAGGSWSDSAPAWSQGRYVWRRMRVDYSDGSYDFEPSDEGVCITGNTGPQGIPGQDGDQGIQGRPGADGKTYYTWLKYADTPTSGMSDSPDGKTYMGLAYNKATATESAIYADYTWSLIKGDKGEQGVPGGKGADGKQLYTWVKYATSASGAGMSDSPAGKTYIGLAYNKTTATESTVATDYAWSLIKGDKGDTGAAGKGIKSNAITYQAGTSGTTAPTGTWQASVPAVAASQYLWTRFVVTYTDDTTTTAYSVGKMGANGSNGSPGAAGKGVKSTAVAYQASASATAAPTGTWAASPPAVAAGQYLWTRFIMTYTDNATTTAYSVARQGANGSNGAAGKPGADGADGKTLYGACNTAGATAAKVTASNIAGFSLYAGVTVAIKFTYANTAASPTLNVNGTGAKQIRLNGANSAYWIAGATVALVYDGTYWQVCNTPLYGSTSTIGNPAGGNVYTDGSGIEIRSGSTALARIKAALVEIGCNAKSAVIKMCGGIGTMMARTGGARDVFGINYDTNAGSSLFVDTVVGGYNTSLVGSVASVQGGVDTILGTSGKPTHLFGTTYVNNQYLADFPVASGTSGAWRYVKFNSGLAIASCHNYHTWSGFGLWGNVYESYNTHYVNYPFTFVTVTYVSCTPLTNYGLWVEYQTDGGQTKSPEIYFNRGAALGAANGYAKWLVVGTWK